MCTHFKLSNADKKELLKNYKISNLRALHYLNHLAIEADKDIIEAWKIYEEYKEWLEADTNSYLEDVAEKYDKIMSKIIKKYCDKGGD